MHPTFHKLNFYCSQRSGGSISIADCDYSYERKFIGFLARCSFLPVHPTLFLRSLRDRVLTLVFSLRSPCPLSRAHRLRLSPTARFLSDRCHRKVPTPHILSAGHSIVRTGFSFSPVCDIIVEDKALFLNKRVIFQKNIKDYF